MTPQLWPTPVTDLAHFRNKIEMQLNFYEDRACLIDDRYRAEVEKVAKRIEEGKLEKQTEIEKFDNRVWANFFRDTMQPGNIALAIQKVRTLLGRGQIAEADQVFEQFRRNLEFVDHHVRQPIFRMGFQFYYGRLRPRRDTLAQLIDEALNELGRGASARAVLNYIRAAPGIDIDSDGAIFWRNARGNEKMTPFRTLQNRVSDRRKNFLQPHKKV